MNKEKAKETMNYVSTIEGCNQQLGKSKAKQEFFAFNYQKDKSLPFSSN